MGQVAIPNLTSILERYDAEATAAALRTHWLQLETKSVASIKAEERGQQETAGVAVPELRAIGKEIGRLARQQPKRWLPLLRLLWDEFGREGRVVALTSLGMLERQNPEHIIPLLRDLCRSCVTWEDADRLAMDGLEPAVRAAPDQWLPAVIPWLADENKWVRRAGLIVVGRLPMNHAKWTGRCLALIEPLTADPEIVVQKATSFAIRLAAQGDVRIVRDWLATQVPPTDPAATWVFCDVIRSMATKLLPEFIPLRTNYAAWAANPRLSSTDRRSVESALKKLGGT